MLEMIALFAINVVSLYLLYKILKFGYNKIFPSTKNTGEKRLTFLERVHFAEDAIHRGEPITEEQLHDLQIYYTDAGKAGLDCFIIQPSNKK